MKNMSDELSHGVNILVHNIVQNLGVKIKPMDYSRAPRVNYIKCVDNIRMMRKNLLKLSDKAKEITSQDNLDLFDVRTVRLFIEKQTNFFDKVYLRSVPLLAPHLKYINKRISQKVCKVHSQNEDLSKNYRSNEASLEARSCKTHEQGFHSKHSSNRGCAGDISIICNSSTERFTKNPPSYVASNSDCTSDTFKLQRRKIETNRTQRNISKIPLPSPRKYSSSGAISMREGNTNHSTKDILKNDPRKDLWNLHKKKCSPSACNLTAGVANYTEKEIVRKKKYLELHAKNPDFIKRNVEIRLYISIKGNKMNNFKVTLPNYQQTLMLCKHAILSLIEPSEQAIVLFENNLSLVIQNHLRNGCTYHFSYPSRRDDYYQALLILNHWSELLVRETNTTLMRTIGGVLGCSPRRILILLSQE